MFRGAVLLLGSALAVPCLASAQALPVAFPVPSISITQTIEVHEVAFVVSGTATLTVISEGVRLDLEVRSDLEALQRIFAPIVQAKANKDERCGDRITIHTASLAPSGSNVVAQVVGHYEKWHCAGTHVPEVHGFKVKMVYHETLNMLFEQNGSLRVTYTPRTDGVTVQLEQAEIALQADGLLGSILGDDLLGPMIRPLVEKAVQDSLNQTTLQTRLIPVELSELGIRLTSIQFIDLGQGRLGAQASATVTVPSLTLGDVLALFK